MTTLALLARYHWLRAQCLALLETADPVSATEHRLFVARIELSWKLRDQLRALGVEPRDPNTI